jgi:cysteine-rich repeat protein
MTRLASSVLGIFFIAGVAACGGSNNATHSCGDGIVNGTEECDDGNTISGDGCSSVCTTEVGKCGDGIIDVATESCDDGNRTPGDGCSANCQVETSATCGNGVVDSGEGCDDHNTAASDGCSASCQVEAGYTCTGSPSVCTMGQSAAGTCAQPIVVTLTNGTGTGTGDTTNMTDQVDGDCDGLVEDGDGLDQVFTFTLAQASDVDIELTADWDPNIRVMRTACDTSTQVSDHVFHDGCADVGVDGEGESFTAQSLPAGTYYIVVDTYDPDPADAEFGPFSFTITASAATAVCGNGVYDDNEECDDGGTAPGGRCSATCTLEYDLAETEPNDDVAHAMTITQTHHQIRGSFSSDSDADFYTFTLTAPATIELETYDAMDPMVDYNGASTLTSVDCTGTNNLIAVFDSTGDTTDDTTALYSDNFDGSYNLDVTAYSYAQCAYIGAADTEGPDPTQGVNLPAGTYTIKLEGIASKEYILDTKFTPDLGGTTAVPPVAGDLVINEAMLADGTMADTNCDGATTSTNDEFVEVANVSNHPVDLTGVTLWDAASLVMTTPAPRHMFAAATSGSMTLDPGKVVVVWGGGAPACAGVNDWFTASSGGLGLNDTGGETITLKIGDATSTTLASATFGDATTGKSFNLNPDLTGTAYALHDAITGHAGAFSPGKKTDGSAF